MLTRIIEELEQRCKFSKSRRDRQKTINVLEVGMVWDMLATRYDTLEVTKTYYNFAKDADLKFFYSRV